MIAHEPLRDSLFGGASRTTGVRIVPNLFVPGPIRRGCFKQLDLDRDVALKWRRMKLLQSNASSRHPVCLFVCYTKNGSIDLRQDVLLLAWGYLARLWVYQKRTQLPEGKCRRYGMIL